ncbi:hypothetical protein CDCA_CDCA17G4343 [Cyanidium caldarium]|uniref:Delta-aminolevulinic acid dehydratase n=1 Tax=Cyanidium caldarium TaxID=2771 RepID=A0AAV9J154_CYACA|nr:hypothetical protein CDCA_CDCA17G4343 [Cyanidium caldarium]
MTRPIFIAPICTPFVARLTPLRNVTRARPSSSRRSSHLLAVSAPDRPSTDTASLSLPRNSRNEPWVEQRSRPRRNRKTDGMRDMVRENLVLPCNLVYPLFIHDETHAEDIAVMPGCQRHSQASMLREVGEALALGVRHVILFPKIAEDLKSNHAHECYNPDGLVPRAVAAIKERFGSQVSVWTDVALDPYSDQGHDGVVSEDGNGDGGCGRILNDVTVDMLCRQALCHARAGADIVAPSDMMDGRVGAIRDALDADGFTDVSIVAYTAKYASAFYGPFRGALDSAPRATSRAPQNKRTYQMDPGNYREALLEASLDVGEGADMLMVKPGVPYLDIIRALHDNTDLPISAYHVSGEYAMLKAAAERGWIDEREAVLETLLCLKRAGATSILTYYAKQAAAWMQGSRR